MAHVGQTWQLVTSQHLRQDVQERLLVHCKVETASNTAHLYIPMQPASFMSGDLCFHISHLLHGCSNVYAHNCAPCLCSLLLGHRRQVLPILASYTLALSIQPLFV